MTGRLGRLGKEGHGRGGRLSSLEFEFRNSRREMCVITMPFYLPGAHIR